MQSDPVQQGLPEMSVAANIPSFARMPTKLTHAGLPANA